MSEDLMICLPADRATMLEGRVAERTAKTLREGLAPLEVPEDQITFSTGSAGYGADAITILATLAAIFLAGKSIEDALTAWPKLASRFKRVVDKLRKKHGSVLVSEPGAVLLGLDALREQGVRTDGAELVGVVVLPVFKAVIPETFRSDFQHQPDRFYLLAYRDAEGDTHAVCLRSSGELEFVHRLPTANWLEYFGVEKK